MHVRAQNAAVVVRMLIDQVQFEMFEVLPKVQRRYVHHRKVALLLSRTRSPGLPRALFPGMLSSGACLLSHPNGRRRLGFRCHCGQGGIHCTRSS
jgi:hypothetical protein